ncbi:hypothetical protein Pedsa_1821 [Pseudopedobacter saltans DSM 12145]|uniref:Secretion system C-terminal sorting domain-containing protein n=1 Tax=Pseudopedobacter saltans (strain ATCC 51119 / DSM 12145 / JCM 21818 / CCUG 39354 / LMG 10337 / NBRC 100064 / NCIMB 13643) TaxID=762903 RepID=F0S8P5_PSESL|nr:T9SS type A sorting domain-containing protein [Pseudopedobacter saltans]ADY52376.1 hypothetical protein Pedsa_1821 [Pseudopedobacter saltans DSM 12145]
MKKRLLLSLALLATTNFTFAQFTPDKLVVVKTTPTSNSNVGNVSLLQMNLDGSPVIGAEETSIPTFYIGLTASTVNNGILRLSSDKKFLTMYGHTTFPSTGNLASTTDARVVTFIDEFQSIKALPTPVVIHSGTQVRSCVAYKKQENIYNIYLSGGSTSATAALQYAELNLSNNTITNPIRIGEYTDPSTNKISGLNSGSVNIFNNQLYAATGLTGATNYLFTKVGTGIPTEVTTINDLSETIPLNTLKIPGDFIFFGKDLLYIADESEAKSPPTFTGAIYKYYSLDNGDTWKSAGSITSPISDDLGFRGIAGRLENGKVTLYAVTSKSKGNSIVKIVDETSKTQTISNSTAGITVNILSTASSTVGYRGISFTPNSTITLPVSLNSFTAKTVNGNIVINWSTASEQNNKYFEILRSTDGVSFTKIGQVAGKNNSSSLNQYSFTDNTPISGTNYYQLKQVDINGESETFGPVSAKIGFENKNNISVIDNEGSITFVITADKNTNSKLTVTDITGRTHFSKQVQLTPGNNTIALDKNLTSGIYIAKIVGTGISITQKFKK